MSPCLASPPTYCSPHQHPESEASYACSRVEPGLAGLAASPLRFYSVTEWHTILPLLNEPVARFLGMLYPRLAEAFPLQGASLQRTLDGELLVAALIGPELTAEQACNQLDQVFPWFIQHSPDEGLLLDFRRF